MNDDLDELVILRPREPYLAYDEFIRCFVDEGVSFPFGEDDALPDQLPADLSRVKCLMLDAARHAELEAGPGKDVLRRFRESGGLIYIPDPKTQVGGELGYFTAMHRAQRVICTSGLTLRHPGMLARLQARDEAKLVAAWRAAAPNELQQYERMGHYFGDPVGCITLRACEAAAEFFEDPACCLPGDRYMAEHYAQYGVGGREHTGGRYLLKYAERSGNAQIREHVLAVARRKSLWQLDGIHLNLDLTVPAGMDPEKPPGKIVDNAWTWPETAAGLGETWPYLSHATGDPSWAERAVRHVLGAFRWLYNPVNGLIMHIGRPTGPDLRSAAWGRGNAWYLYALRGLLDDLPAEHPARPELIRILKTILDGLLRYQDDYGLWHNVVDADPADSRPCASATSRYLHVYARAYHQGWLPDPRIPDMVRKAWAGLKTKIWNTGLVAYCVGTSYGLSRQVYLARPHHTFRCSRSEMLLNWIERQRMG